MADPMTGPIPRCPWCSAALPESGAEQCPVCHAQLVAAPDTPGEIKGVTTLDTEAILRARTEATRPRGNRLLSFITGETQVDAGADSPDSFARPDLEVRREMLRLQLQAEAADLQAETVALKADELARRGIHLSELAGPEPAPAPEPAADGSWPEELTPPESEAPPPA